MIPFYQYSSHLNESYEYLLTLRLNNYDQIIALRIIRVTCNYSIRYTNSLVLPR